MLSTMNLHVLPGDAQVQEFAESGIDAQPTPYSPIGLRVHGKDGFSREPVRGVEMEALDEEGEIHFLAPNSMDTGAARIEVRHQLLFHQRAQLRRVAGADVLILRHVLSNPPDERIRRHVLRDGGRHEQRAAQCAYQRERCR